MSDPLDAMRKDPAGFWEARYRNASPTSSGRPGTALRQLVEPLAPGTALELGAGLARTEDGEAGLAQGVGHAQTQGRLGADHHQADLLLATSAHQGGRVLTADPLQVATDPRGPGVPGRREDLVHQGRLRDLPSQGVLAPSTADDQDFHGA